MKKYIFLIAAQFVFVAGFCQEPDKNYTKSTQYKVATNSGSVNPEEKVVTVTYYDGLGRPIQQIAQGQSAVGENIITHMEYDSFGRMKKEFLPHPSSGTSLDFSTSAATDVANHYGSAYPFSEKFFEDSPLDRVLKQSAPGEPWAGNPNNDNDHAIKFVYETNGEDEVRLFVTAISGPTNGVYIPSAPSGSSYYSPTQLSKTITKDENWVSGTNHTTEEFKDKQGRIVLKRTYAGNREHDTYYVYDKFGNLTFVIPPLAVADFPDLDLCYQYRYDARNRLVEKKLPDRDWEYIVYDALDRVRLTGPVYHPSGNGNHVWLFNKHDEFNRVLYTGVYNGTGTRETLQASVDAIPSELFEARVDPYTPSSDAGVTLIYTQKVFPKNNYNVLTINYYDDYVFPGAPTSFPTSILNGTDYGVHYDNSIKPRGLNTGSWVRVPTPTGPAVGETTYILYDKKQRPVRTRKTNYLGGFTNTDVLYDFSKQAETETTHSRSSQTAGITVSNLFEYTPEDRMLKHMHRINNMDKHVLAENEYEPLGKIITKKVGGIHSVESPYQKIDFTYNIRSWLTGINNVDNLEDLFAFKINYEDVDDNLSGEVSGLYNGNISETFWRSATDDVLRKYGYKYDALNRLKKAFYQKPDMLTPYAGGYDEELSYDANGNITQINRNGHADAVLYPHQIDELYLTYEPNSNRLIKTYDATNDPNGFKDEEGLGGTYDGDDDYRYDTFGNLTFDQNKSIDSISYNHLNLPLKIVFANQDEINYLYDATGVKVHKSVKKGTDISNTDYLGEFQYFNNFLNFIHHAEGYVKCTNMGQYTAFSYVYQYKDHLGNIRMNYSKNPQTGMVEIVDENHYYPFGLKHTNYNVDEKDFIKEEEILELKVPPAKVGPYNYKYNGKEWQDELGLNLYPFKWRSYDPAIGRFISIDPVAENYPHNGVYNFAENRVVESIDLEGKESWFAQDGGLATKAGPYTNAARKQLNLYSPSEIQQMKARPQSNPKGPTFSQDRMTAAERKQHDSGVKAQMAQTEAIRQTLNNHENLGSPYTAKTVMEGVAYGAADLVTGEVIGKLFQGAKMLFSTAKAEETIVVIGEGMGRVKDAKGALLENGAKNVEVFEPSPQALEQWESLTSGGVRLSDEAAQGTMLYQENVNWIQQATQSGKTILDIGNDGRAMESTFYKMEKQAVYGN